MTLARWLEKRAGRVVSVSVLAFLAAMEGFGGYAPTAGQADEVMVIVNGDNTWMTSDVREIRTYWLKGRQEWPNGVRVSPADRDGESVARKLFLAKVLGMSNDEVERYWIEKRYQAGVSPPRKAASDAQMIEFVGAVKGAVGFVDVRSLAGITDRKVKVIASYR